MTNYMLVLWDNITYKGQHKHVAEGVDRMPCKLPHMEENIIKNEIFLILFYAYCQSFIKMNKFLQSR